MNHNQNVLQGLRHAQCIRQSNSFEGKNELTTVPPCRDCKIVLPRVRMNSTLTSQSSSIAWSLRWICYQSYIHQDHPRGTTVPLFFLGPARVLQLQHFEASSYAYIGSERSIILEPPSCLLMRKLRYRCQLRAGAPECDNSTDSTSSLSSSSSLACQSNKGGRALPAETGPCIALVSHWFWFGICAQL